MIDLHGPEFDSMRAVLRQGALTFDVGAHDGHSSLLIAELVGPEKTVIVEPHQQNWARIRWSWEKIYGARIKPAATCQGFVSAEVLGSKIEISDWPKDLDYHTVLPGGAGPFGSLCESTHNNIGRTTIDELTRVAGGPTALLIDIEGAELQAVVGAQETMACHHPKLWISVHPDLLKNFGNTADQLFDFTRDFGYKKTYLGEEQEQYYLFE